MQDYIIQYVLPNSWGACHVVARYVSPGDLVSPGQAIMSIKMGDTMFTVAARNNGEIQSIEKQFSVINGGEILLHTKEISTKPLSSFDRIRPVVFQDKKTKDGWISFDENGNPYKVNLSKEDVVGQGKNPNRGQSQLGDGENETDAGNGSKDAGAISSARGQEGFFFKGYTGSKTASRGGILIGLISAAITAYFMTDFVMTYEHPDSVNATQNQQDEDGFTGVRYGIVGVTPNNEWYIRKVRNSATLNRNPDYLVWDSKDITVVDILQKNDVLLSNDSIVFSDRTEGQPPCELYQDDYYFMISTRDLASSQIKTLPLRKCQPTEWGGLFNIIPREGPINEVMVEPLDTFIIEEKYAYYQQQTRQIPVNLTEVINKTENQILFTSEGEECDIPTRPYTQVYRQIQYTQDLEIQETLLEEITPMQAYAFSGNVKDIAPGCELGSPS